MTIQDNAYYTYSLSLHLDLAFASTERCESQTCPMYCEYALHGTFFVEIKFVNLRHELTFSGFLLPFFLSCLWMVSDDGVCSCVGSHFAFIRRHIRRWARTLVRSVSLDILFAAVVVVVAARPRRQFIIIIAFGGKLQ